MDLKVASTDVSDQASQQKNSILVIDKENFAGDMAVRLLKVLLLKNS